MFIKKEMPLYGFVYTKPEISYQTSPALSAHHKYINPPVTGIENVYHI